MGKQNIFEEINNKLYKVMYCESDGIHYWFKCELGCNKNHYHGVMEGHRASQCPIHDKLYKESGYILRLKK